MVNPGDIVKSFLSVGAMVFGLTAHSGAAEIRVDPDPSGDFVFISVEGEFIAGDEKKFTQQALQQDKAIVVFHSPGGSTLTGLEIGKAIRLKGFWTYVPADAVCASACGYAWLGGVQRYMEPTSRIGFHASYISENGINRESGVGNALVGAYLNSLGLSQSAIAYISTASPDSMTWMTKEDAESVGIEVKIEDGSEEPRKEQERLPETSDDDIVVVPLDPPAGQVPSSETPEPTKVPGDGRVPVISHMAGADIFGHDLPGMPLRNISAPECEEACVADRRCQAFTFNARHAVCFLKSDGERVFNNPNAFAGYKAALQTKLRRSSITIMERTDYPGNDYRELADVGFAVCSDTCENEPRCRAFTYMAKRKSCWLKEKASQPVSSRLTISGKKE